VKKISALLIAPLITLASFTAYGSGPAFFGHSLLPYAGIDMQYRYMSYDKKQGDNVFKKTFPQANIYAGFRVNDYVGVELGYEITATRTRQVLLSPGQYEVGGDPIERGAFLSIIGVSRLHGLHTNLVGFYPILDYCPNLKLIGSIGVSNLRIILESIPVADEAGPIPPGDPYTRTYVARRNVLRLGGGFQHMVTPCVGLRGMINWEETSRFRHILPKQPATPDIYAVVKNSYSVSFGIFVNF